ncbi:MAG: APC family permease [Blastocatellia bacterium]
MTDENKSIQPQLVRSMKLRDLIFFNVAAVLGLRHLATSASFGAGSLVLWVLAALLFFIPQGLAVVELSSRFPNEGGIYDWTKRALGEGHGFLCGWCYWISNAPYYPSLLLSAAVISTYVLGKGESELSQSWPYVLSVTLISLWLAVALNIIGLSAGKWLQNIGAMSTYILGVVIILFGVIGVLSEAPANPFTAQTLIPDFGNLGSLNLLASVAFAFAGIELIATMGGEIENPRRNLPRSVFLAAPLIALAYVLGAGAVLWLVPVGQINVVSGFLQAISIGAQRLSAELWWIAPVCAALYVIGIIGGVGAWLIGPARVAFVIGLDRYFPAWFGRVHQRWRTPYAAILVQAALATGFLLISVLGRGTKVEEVYLILLDTQLLVYFIPFVYLFVAFLIHRNKTEPSGDVTLVPGGKLGGWLIGLSGLAVTLFAMIVALIPPGSSANRWLFFLKVIGGALAFVAVGGVIYFRSTVKTAFKSYIKFPIRY